MLEGGGGGGGGGTPFDICSDMSSMITNIIFFIWPISRLMVFFIDKINKTDVSQANVNRTPALRSAS